MSLVLLAGCGPDPDQSLVQAQDALAAGDAEASQAAFRRGLERHPEHLQLLLFAAEFYLEPEREEHHKPRLALHYASRASRTDGGGAAEVDALHIRALRAMDQHDDARALLQDALSRHPDDPNLAALRDP